MRTRNRKIVIPRVGYCPPCLFSIHVFEGMEWGKREKENTMRFPKDPSRFEKEKKKKGGPISSINWNVLKGVVAGEFVGEFVVLSAKWKRHAP